MLPSIISVAGEYGLEINERTREAKEVLAKCPFCGGEHPHKFHLSMNQEKDIFKCWQCNKGGGVLQFESELSGKPFNEVRGKYFKGGNRQADRHPAYKLSPAQLREIGWQELKRDNFNSFRSKREDVLRDWQIYQFEELAKHYAIFLLIANYPKDEKRKDLYVRFIELTNLSKIDNLRGMIEAEYKSPQGERWSERGKSVARKAYRLSKATDSFHNVFANVLLAIELLKMKKKVN